MVSTSKSIKCSGVYKSTQPCEKKGKSRYGYFCCHEHQEQARKYASDIMERHKTALEKAEDDSEYIPTFNRVFRVQMCQSIILGRQQQIVEYSAQGQKETVKTLGDIVMKTDAIQKDGELIEAGECFEKILNVQSSIQNRLENSEERLSGIKRRSDGADDVCRGLKKGCHVFHNPVASADDSDEELRLCRDLP